MDAELESLPSAGFSVFSSTTRLNLLLAAEQISMSRELPCSEAMAWETAGARKLSTIARHANHAVKRRFFLENCIVE